ncbi:polyphosphate--glucose phosphotransferase [Gulosibacter bifidus]|uniref:Polyphosphate--glucose phosphotransferase n=1 Tax=Gulosibacter bifidus TaxID=272239 RepID=A0ABW5RHM4_9MICO|nr:ROK family protein [Gulosibacter bifidus]
MTAEATRYAIGIDIGGTGIKGAVVNVADGTLVGERCKVKTPEGASITEVLDAVATLRTSICSQALDLPRYLPVGICMPSVIRHGRSCTAANIAPEWVGYEAATGFSEALGQRVSLVNDADAAGYGEVRFGAARDTSGSILVITLGTGIGSALIYNGKLFPNTELGHLELDGHPDFERVGSARGREVSGLSFKAWAQTRLTPYFQKLEQLICPDAFIVSGGVSKRPETFLPYIDCQTPIEVAGLTNNAGIIGAALLGAEGWD